MEHDSNKQRSTMRTGNERLKRILHCRAAMRDEGLVDVTGQPVGCPATHVLAEGLDELLAGECDWEAKRSRIVALELALRRTQVQVDQLHRTVQSVFTAMERQGA